MVGELVEASGAALYDDAVAAVADYLRCGLTPLT
jgi:hypothetical protein